MKRLSFILTFAFISMLAMSSCKKDYTCSCTLTEPGEADIKSSITINGKKKDAKEACEALNSSVGDIKNTCAID